MDQPHVTYTVSQKICPHFNFLNNCKKLTDFNDFWFVKSWEKLTSKLLISPVRCSHFTLRNSKKSLSTILVIHTFDYLRYLRIKRSVTVTELAHHIWKMSLHYLAKCRTCSSDWRYIVFLQKLVDFGGCEKSRLWCITTWMSRKQRHSKCSKWLTFCMYTHFQSFSPLYTMLCTCPCGRVVNALGRHVQ